MPTELEQQAKPAIQEASDNESFDMAELSEDDAPKQPKFTLNAATKSELNQARQDLEKQKAKDTIDRYKFLLGQSDLFSHFIRSKGLVPEEDGDAGTPTITNAAAASGKKKKAAASGSSRRGRKTEKEEDEELLQEELDEENDSAAPLNTETVFSESPSYVTGGKLRDYQVHGLNWMISLFEHGINGILADEMGLGKTLQTISFLGYLKHYRDMPGPNMVLVPKSTLQNWVNEFHRWVPDFKVLLFHGSKDERAELVASRLFTKDWEICVTSYETCMAEKNHLRKLAWKYIVIDEAHRIKNENSLLSQIMRTFTCRNRLLLTGTPLQNNLKELWALLNFLLPDIFSTYEEFDEYLQGSNEDQDTVVSQLHAVLRPFLLRRLKADVEKSLLPKKRINLYVGMTDMQRQWYQKILSKDVEAMNGAVRENREGKTRLLNIVMQLRKCCNHPYLFDGAEPGPPYTTDQHLVDNSGKMVLLDKLLPALKAKGSRVLIFSQMSRVLDILEDYCMWREFEYCRLDGQTAHEDRIRDIDEYNKPDSSKFIFLLTTRAGGLGINLATADTVIMYDSDWNPQVDLQAEDRAHRIGQKKQVVVFRFITENAIEDKVIERAASKLRLDQLVIQQGRVAQQNKALNKNELVSMIQHGADQILNGPGYTLNTDVSIDEIIKKGEERTAQLEQKFQTLGLDDLQKFSLDTGNMYKFEGKDFSNAKASSSSIDWIAPARREKKVGGYSIDDYYRQQLSTTTRTNEPKQPRPPRQVTIADFQFFPQRLNELQRKELYYFWKELGYQVPRATVTENGDESEEDLEARRAEEQAKIDSAEPLADDEKAEMETLRTEGFYQWNKRDFNAFIRGCEKFGRDKLEDIANEMEGKSLEDVKEYAQVFWERYEEIEDFESILDRVERGEDKIRKRSMIQDQLTNIVNMYRHPLQLLQIPYGNTQKSKNYTEEEDRFLVVALQKHGYNTDDVYEIIRKEIRQHPAFRFDWFIKSRSTTEINRRCTTLINLLMKDVDMEEEDGGANGANGLGGGARKGSKRRGFTAGLGNGSAPASRKSRKVK